MLPSACVEVCDLLVPTNSSSSFAISIVIVAVRYVDSLSVKLATEYLPSLLRKGTFQILPVRELLAYEFVDGREDRITQTTLYTVKLHTGVLLAEVSPSWM